MWHIQRGGLSSPLGPDFIALDANQTGDANKFTQRLAAEAVQVIGGHVGGEQEVKQMQNVRTTAKTTVCDVDKVL